MNNPDHTPNTSTKSVERPYHAVDVRENFGSRFDAINEGLSRISRSWSDDDARFESLDFPDGTSLNQIAVADVWELIGDIEAELAMFEQALEERAKGEGEREQRRAALIDSMGPVRRRIDRIRLDLSLADAEVGSLQTDIAILEGKIEAAIETRREKGNDPLYKHHRNEPNSQPVLEYNFAVENERELEEQRDVLYERINVLVEEALAREEADLEELRLRLAELDALPTPLVQSARRIRQSLSEIADYVDTFGSIPEQATTPVEDTVEMRIDDTRTDMALPPRRSRKKRPTCPPGSGNGNGKRRKRHAREKVQPVSPHTEHGESSGRSRKLIAAGITLTAMSLAIALMNKDAIRRRFAERGEGDKSVLGSKEDRIGIQASVLSRSLESLPTESRYGDVRTFFASLKQKGLKGEPVNGERPWDVSIMRPFDRQYEDIRSKITFLADSKARGHDVATWHEVRTELYALGKAADEEGIDDVREKVEELQTQLDIVDQLEQDIPDPALLARLMRDRVDQIRPHILAMPDRPTRLTDELFTVGEGTEDILRSHGVMTTKDVDRKVVEEAVRSGSMTQITEADDVPVAWGEHGYAFLFTDVSKEGDPVWVFSRADNGVRFPVKIGSDE